MTVDIILRLAEHAAHGIERTVAGDPGLRRHLASTSANWFRDVPANALVVAVGTLITERPPHRSRRALLTHRAPPSGRTWCDTRFEPACAPAHSRQSDRRGSSAQCPNHARLSAVPPGHDPSLPPLPHTLPPFH